VRCRTFRYPYADLLNSSNRSASRSLFRSPSVRRGNLINAPAIALSRSSRERPSCSSSSPLRGGCGNPGRCRSAWHRRRRGEFSTAVVHSSRPAGPRSSSGAPSGWPVAAEPGLSTASSSRALLLPIWHDARRAGLIPPSLKPGSLEKR
jgi:hypothetical protein